MVATIENKTEAQVCHCLRPQNDKKFPQHRQSF